MPCNSCHSDRQKNFPAEINIHFPGRESIDKPTVWAFPLLLVCLDCGTTEFALGEPELQMLERSRDIRRGAASNL
jgi:hypothetical protein